MPLPGALVTACLLAGACACFGAAARRARLLRPDAWPAALTLALLSASAGAMALHSLAPHPALAALSLVAGALSLAPLAYIGAYLASGERSVAAASGALVALLGSCLFAALLATDAVGTVDTRAGPLPTIAPAALSRNAALLLLAPFAATGLGLLATGILRAGRRVALWGAAHTVTLGCCGIGALGVAVTPFALPAGFLAAGLLGLGAYLPEG